MSNTKAGIFQIGLTKKGTLLSTPTNITLLGLRPASMLNVKPFEPIKDTLDRPLRNKQEFKITAKTLQPSILKLKNIISQYIPDDGCDAELLGMPTSAAGGVFQFTGDNYMGLDFDYLMSNKERSLLYNLAVALEYPNAQTLLAAASSNTPATLAGTNYGIDFTKQRFPWLNFTDGTFLKNEIVDYSFSLKANGKNKDLHERMIIDYIMCHFEITFRSASLSNIATELSAAQCPAFDFRQDTSSTTYEKFSFAANVLAKTDEIEIGDEKRFIKVIYDGLIPIQNFSFSLTSGSGGGTSADGSEGGTVSISA